MPIDPRIALGVQQFQLQDPLAQYGRVMAIQGAQQQNALAQLQMRQAEREQEATNALNAAYREAYNPQTGDVDLNKLRSSLATGGYGAKLPDLEKKFGELKTQRLTQQKTEADLFDTSMRQIRNLWSNVRTPEDAIAVHEATHRDPIINKRLQALGVTEQMGRQQIMQAAQNPQSFAEFVQRAQLGAEKFMELNKPTTQVIDQSGQRQVIQIPGLGGAPTTVGTYADVPLPANVVAQKKEIARAGAPTTQVNVSTEKKYGERFGGLIAESDAAKLAAAEKAPEAAATADRVMDLIGTGKVITGTGANARLQIAKALNLAGGTDSERIRNTEVLISSLAETTLGAIKSSNLGAGQGFTNADRDFLEKAKAGQLTYDSKSLAELARLSRLAAEKSAESWNTRVKQIPAAALQGTGISTEPVIVPKRSKPAAADTSSIPAAAIQALRAGQGTAEQFDAVFGAGAAAKVLKGK